MAQTASQALLSASDPRLVEWIKCAESVPYFVNTYCKIYDSVSRDWEPFSLWPAQRATLMGWTRHQFNIALKARQVGLTWLALAFGLHGMLFNPIFEFLIFSKREDEALYLSSNERLRGMYARLPEWMRAASVVIDDKRHWRLSNGSGARAFPTTAGDSYTASLALVDEADLVPNLEGLMLSAKPTIDAGGKLLLISKADKSRPRSMFKQIYRAAREGSNEWNATFIPWNAHPGRSPAWYAKQVSDALQNTGSLDSLYENYPETEEEALAPQQTGKRFAYDWLVACYERAQPLDVSDAPPIPGLRVYAPPLEGVRYAIGADPAEGNPTSDDSALVVKRRDTGESVAHLSDKFEPSVLASHIATLSTWYRGAPALIERNNHGHAVLLWLRDHSKVKRLPGLDKREGWLNNSLGKTTLYNSYADALRDRAVALHDAKTYDQLSAIEGGTLRAPQGEMDDCADAEVLAFYALGLAETPFLVRTSDIRFKVGNTTW